MDISTDIRNRNWDRNSLLGTTTKTFALSLFCRFLTFCLGPHGHSLIRSASAVHNQDMGPVQITTVRQSGEGMGHGRCPLYLQLRFGYGPHGLYSEEVRPVPFPTNTPQRDKMELTSANSYDWGLGRHEKFLSTAQRTNAIKYQFISQPLGRALVSSSRCFIVILTLLHHLAIAAALFSRTGMMWFVFTCLNNDHRVKWTVFPCMIIQIIINLIALFQIVAQCGPNGSVRREPSQFPIVRRY